MKRKLSHSRKTDLISKYQNGVYEVESYVNSASLLNFTNNYSDALYVLDAGLKHHPNNEELIRAKFTFVSHRRDLLQALEIAENHPSVFENDEYDDLTKAIDLIRISMDIRFMEASDDFMVMETLDKILHDFNENKIYDIHTLTHDMIHTYHLPKVGLGFAKVFAEKGDADSQVLLGNAYLHGFHVQKDLTKARHYISEAASSGHETAIKMLEELKFAPSMS